MWKVVGNYRVSEIPRKVDIRRLEMGGGEDDNIASPKSNGSCNEFCVPKYDNIASPKQMTSYA